MGILYIDIISAINCILLETRIFLVVLISLQELGFTVTTAGTETGAKTK
jgi:hypothetical protein